MYPIIIAAEAAKDAEKAASFAPFDPWHFPSQIFWLVVLFGTLYIVLSRIILPRIGSTLERRESTIASDLDEAARLNEEAVDAQKAVDVSIAKAHAKARETADKARGKIDKEIATETAKVDAEVDKKLAEAESRISALRADAMQNVEGIAIDAAASVLGKFGSKATDAKLKSAVKTALEEG
jgi:F-type H+-transporting ATPase subunit b